MLPRPACVRGRNALICYNSNMEWVLLIVASIIGGIGNGLAGISAATVLVPVLIVLCPTFSGEAGAFQATTLALTCHILSSAVTAAVYMRHGNIDLARGKVMLGCVWAASIAGSVVAFMVGGAVLGGFCLVLTFCIGIRYLVKPDSDRGRDAAGDASAGLDARALAVSLFFGLTIGFGTGFVGTGGGMMMFIVFTAFLGYSARKAVGTATFIMTGTALIASVTHYLMDATLLTDHADIVLACVAISTVTSLVSARFANRVDGKVVGLTTGVILTVLGASMIALNYHEFFAALFAEGGLGGATMLCLQRYVLFLLPVLVVLVVVKVAVPGMPREVFRKLLHAVAFCSGVVLAYSADDWRAAAIACALFAVAVYPVLALAERWRGYADIFNQRRSGEVKTSLLLLFGVSAVAIAFCWGAAGQRVLVLATLLTWGFGDAAAGLVGRRYGRRPVGLPLADPKKTREGTLAFAGVAFVTCCVTLAFASGYPVAAILAGSAFSALVGAYVEAVSRNGIDTVTVPVAIALVLVAVFACLI